MTFYGTEEDVNTRVNFRGVLTFVIVVRASRVEWRDRFAKVAAIHLYQEVTAIRVNRFAVQRAFTRDMWVPVVVLLSLVAGRYLRVVVLIGDLIVVRRYVRHVATPSQGHFARLVESVVVRVIVPAFLAVVFYFLCVHCVDSLWYRYRAICGVVIGNRCSERILRRVVFPAVGVSPDNEVSV